jgi:CheY-like chemotaxis protein
VTARRRRVLLVDDEPNIRRALQRVLGRENEVVVVEDGQAALEHLRGGARYDVILCDVMMPKMGGVELYDHLRAEDPEQAKRMIFMTGGAFGERSSELVAASDCPLLAKPIDRAALRDAFALVDP